MVESNINVINVKVHGNAFMKIASSRINKTYFFLFWIIKLEIQFLTGHNHPYMYAWLENKIARNPTGIKSDV